METAYYGGGYTCRLQDPDYMLHLDDLDQRQSKPTLTVKDLQSNSPPLRTTRKLARSIAKHDSPHSVPVIVSKKCKKLSKGKVDPRILQHIVEVCAFVFIWYAVLDV